MNDEEIPEELIKQCKKNNNCLYLEGIGWMHQKGCPVDKYMNGEYDE